MVRRATNKVGLHSEADLCLCCTLILVSAKVLSLQTQKQSCNFSDSTLLPIPITPVRSGSWGDYSYLTAHLRDSALGVVPSTELGAKNVLWEQALLA